MGFSCGLEFFKYPSNANTCSSAASFGQKKQKRAIRNLNEKKYRAIRRIGPHTTASLKEFNIKWKIELAKTLRLKYSIVQAPMPGVITPEIVAVISNQGGLGSLPVGGLPPEKQ